MKHQLPRLAALAALVLALPAIGRAAGTRHVAVLQPGGPDLSELAEAVRWLPSQDSSGNITLESPLHPLSPRLVVGEHASAAVQIPGAGTLRMTPLAVGPLEAGFTPGRRSVEVGSGEGRVAFVRDAWEGVDEQWTLRRHALKHDLVLHERAVALLAGRDLVASWILHVPAGATFGLEERGGAILRDASGAFLARIPEPLVEEAGEGHAHVGPTSMAVTGGEGGVYRVAITLSGTWLADVRREFPVLLDPTVALEPLDIFKTGFVDELGLRLDDEMVTGTLEQIGRGAENRAYAEFNTSGIPDSATITDVDLRIWLSNHDNPGDPAQELIQDFKHCALQASASNAALWAAIPGPGLGRMYTSDIIPWTGIEWCPEAYIELFYDLGLLAEADVQSQLASDFFTLGLASNIGVDPLFDHIDQIGYSEIVNSPFCSTTALPGSRITLFVTYETNLPPLCNAGGPYTSDCPTTPFVLDGTLSSDPDGDPITYLWSSDCSGSITPTDAAIATLQLDPSCAEDCTVTLEVSDGALSTSCTVPVSAADLTPPDITGNLLAGLCIWPPRHDFFCITDPASYVSAVDSCQPGVTFSFTGCTSSQSDEAPEPGLPENGDGHFPGDCVVSPDGSEICVRVERAGTEPEGRYYGIGVAADDGCGNVVTVSGLVHVPHDRRGGSGGQDDPCQRGGGR